MRRPMVGIGSLTWQCWRSSACLTWNVALEAYYDEWPLSDGYAARVELHQVYPLLVHAILFGGSYAAAETRAARQAVG